MRFIEIKDSNGTILVDRYRIVAVYAARDSHLLYLDIKDSKDVRFVLRYDNAEERDYYYTKLREAL